MAMVDLSSIEVFITPHAVAQFQQRIARLGDEKTREFILKGIRQSTDVKVLPDGTSLRVRIKRPFPFEFRAFCVFDIERGHFVITTVVRGDSASTRKSKARLKKTESDRR